MSNELDLTPGVGGYRVTNPAVMLTTCLKASLDIFNMTSMEELSKKSFLLTGSAFAFHFSVCKLLPRTFAAR